MNALPKPGMPVIRRLGWVILSVCAVLVWWSSLHRDIRYSREYMGDLRNRVVGARIIADGGSPYFYKYRPWDPVRYYDPQAFDIYSASICTSTPFLHRLLIPLAELPFAEGMRVWMVVMWALYLAMTAYAFALARAPEARAAVVAVAILILLTNAWELHAKYGQTYLLIPALATLVFALQRRGGVWWSLAAGAAATALVMVRPNAVLFILPLLFMKTFRWISLLPGVIAFGWVLLNPHERWLWGEYEAMLGEQVKIHQDLGPKRRPVWIDPGVNEWEGINMDTARARQERDPVKIYSENGNVFVLYKKVTGRKMPLAVLSIFGVFAVVLGFTALIVRRKTGVSSEAPMRRRYGDLDPAQLAIIGYCLYMISDLFSPIYRHAYYGVQWIMPLLLAATIFRWRDRAVYGWLLLCLLLNVIHLPFIRMANSIGEYGFLVGLFLIGFAHRVENLHRDI